MTPNTKICAIIGAGPAGLMAAERLASLGHSVTVYDRMPSAGRKFLLAGRGGLNLTHTDAPNQFIAHYRDAAPWLKPILDAFSPEAVREWCAGLGEDSFAGSSGRVFPKSFKASPLLRAWLRRLDSMGVRFRPRQEWMGWNDQGALVFKTPDAEPINIEPDVTLLALGGASWPKLGADGGWVGVLEARSVEVAPLIAANTGVVVPWSDLMKDRFAGAALKRIIATCDGTQAKGEAIVTKNGLEGGAIYALGPDIRKALALDGKAVIHLDLRRDLPLHILTERLMKPRGKQSISTWLHKAAGLAPAAIALLREEAVTGLKMPFDDPVAMAKWLKALPLHVQGLTGIERAISTAGGVCREELDDQLMLKRLPGVFVAGEMIDWEAPTGGYLLQACFSTGIVAANGMTAWLDAANA